MYKHRLLTEQLCIHTSLCPLCVYTHVCVQNKLLSGACASLCLCIKLYESDTSTYEQAIQECNDEPQQLQFNTLAFMFETSHMANLQRSQLPCFGRAACGQGLLHDLAGARVDGQHGK